MYRQSVSDAALLARRDCIGHTCGTNIDTEDVDFTKQQHNLTYIDKVFSFNNDTSSPILFNLNTGGLNTDNYTVRLVLGGSSLFPCTLSANAVFEIDNSFVVVDFFGTRPPGNIDAGQVTLDGFSVDSLGYASGLYTARIENVLSRVQKDRCLDRGLPTKVFFLINNAGPWEMRATYVLEGTVNTNGRICRFRAEISNTPDAGNTLLPNTSFSTFAVRGLSLPCSINGIAPRITFQFSAKVNLVNPTLVVSHGSPCGDMDSAALGVGAPCGTFINPAAISPTVSLVSAVSVEPVLHVQTVRRTLFCINACEGLQPCQGSIAAAEAEEDLEDCAVGGVDRPDCSCKKKVINVTSDCGETAGNQGCGCNNNVAGTGTAPQNQRARNSVLGASDKALLQRLLNEIRDELEGDTSDAAGIGYGPDDAFGAKDDEVSDTSEQIRNTVRPVSRRNGPNGCSW